MNALSGIVMMVLLAACACRAERLSFDEGWRFALCDPQGAERADFDDSDWRLLDVPHDWSIEGEYDRRHPMGGACGYLPAGIGWYRKTVPISAEWKRKHVQISFDGICMNSMVWVNGKKLAERPYGWSSFSVDVSEIVDASENLTVAVRVDNEKQPSARWYTGSGIYAHVWLDVKSRLHIPTDGVFGPGPRESGCGWMWS